MVCTRFVLKNHLTAAYLYIWAENSSIGVQIYSGFCKMLWYCSTLFILNQFSQLWIKEKKKNNIFTGLNVFFNALNFRFWHVSELWLFLCLGWGCTVSHYTVKVIQQRVILWLFSFNGGGRPQLCPSVHHVSSMKGHLSRTSKILLVYN